MNAPNSRYNMYRLIHKGLRAYAAEILTALGRLDADDPAEVAAVCGRVDAFLDFCHHHMGNEDRHVHPAMEARAAGSTATVAADHVHHGAAIGRLKATLANARRDAEAVHALYLDLAVFIGENLEHMNVEETHNNAVLWRCYDDSELAAIERSIVAALPPEEMAATLRWMVPSATPAERAAFLSSLREAVPAPVFADIMALVSPHLSTSDVAKLDAVLGHRVAA